MIVVPLNEEARSGRRPPWITLILVALCVGVFLFNRAGDRAVDAATEAAVDEAWTYFAAHPYVEVDEDVASLLGAPEVEATAQAFQDRLAAAGSPGIPGFVRQHDQLAFDQYVDAIYAAMEGHSFYRLGFDPATLSAPDASLLTYVVAHEGWLHLISNLVLILMASLFLEEVWGRAIFGVFLLVGAAAGAAGYAWLDPEAGEVLGGASGLAAALGGAFLVRFATTPIRFQYFFIPPVAGKFTARGWVVLPIYGATYLIVDYVLKNGVPGVEPSDSQFATWSHVGGLAAGVAFAGLLKVLQIEERFVHPKIEKKMTTRSNPLLDKALEAREDGRLEEAVELLANAVARHPEDRDACLAFWDAASAVERPAQAVEALARVLRDEVNAGQKELAVQHWRELAQRVPDFPLEVAVEARVVPMLVEIQEHGLAQFSIARLLEGHGGTPGVATAFRLARVAREFDPSLAAQAAHVALSNPAIEPEQRSKLEAFVAELGESIAPIESEALADEGARSAFDPSGYAADPDDETDDDGLDGDTLNAEPFELDDLTPPPGVNTYDLEGGEASAPSPDASAPSLDASAPLLDGAPPSLDELPSLDDAPPSLDDAPPSLGADALDALDLDDGSAPPSLGADDPDALDPGALDLDDGSAPASLGADDPGALDPGALDLDDASAPPLAAADGDALDLDEGSAPPSAAEGADAFDPAALDLAGETGTSLDALDPSGPGEAGGASLPGLGDSGSPFDPGAVNLGETTGGAPRSDAADAPPPDPDLDATGPNLDATGPDLAASTPGPAAVAADPGASQPELGTTAPGLGTTAPGLGTTAPGLGDSSPSLSGWDEADDDLGSLEDSAPSLDGLGDDIPLADPSERTRPPTDEPDYGNTIDMEALGAETIPGYDPNAPALDLAEPGEPPVEAAAVAPPEPVPPPSVPRRPLKIMEAIPLGVADGALTLDVGERGKAQLALEKIEAVAAAGVRGLRPKPVVLIDVVTNWRSGGGQPLKIVRLRSDRFDPLELMEGEENGVLALKRWIAALISESDALPLPDAAGAVGSPFRMYDDLDAYQREVLGAP